MVSSDGPCSFRKNLDLGACEAIFVACWLTDPPDLSNPFASSRLAGSDSPESAAKELGQIFEGWDQNWWIELRRKEL